MPVFGLLILFLVCGGVAAENTPRQDPADPNLALIQKSRIEFEVRLDAWRQRPSFSSQFEFHVSDDLFRKLLEVGPVAIPWLAKEPESVFLRFAIEALLRTQWSELSRYSADPALRVDLYTVFRSWPSRGPQAIFEAQKRMTEFRDWRKQQSPGMSYEEVRQAGQWKRLQNIGIFGIPCVIQNIRVGHGDEYDYRLLTYWTGTLEPNERGVPRPPKEKQTIPNEKRNSQFWLQWWKANAWQYWWLPNPKTN